MLLRELRGVKCAELGAVHVVLQHAFAGFYCVAVPVSFTNWGLPAQGSCTSSWPVMAPLEAGAKLTEMVQKAPGAKLAGQLFVWGKSGLCEMMLRMASDCSAVFLRVMVCAGLWVPTVWLGNVRLRGVSLA